MMSIFEIKLNMPVFCAEYAQFAEVDQLEGPEYSKLKKEEPVSRHYVPDSWVVSTDTRKVKIDRPGEEAIADWSIEPVFSK